jgi:uncharacterized protein (DUF1800 family)
LPPPLFCRTHISWRAFEGAFCLTALMIASNFPAGAQQIPPELAAQYLELSTFGPNPALIAHVQSIGFPAFLNEQFVQQPSNYPTLPLQPTTVPVTCTGTCVRDNYSMYPVQLTFFTSALGQNGLGDQDQLRQRVAFALQQIFVTSGLTITQPSWMTPYLQIFDRDAFGNFRQLLDDITLNPAMGGYLNMAGNTKTAPNENYGREVLQLFTIGLNMLNPDGSVVTDSLGNPVPSYTQAIVDAFSKVFTGWNYCAAVNTTTCKNFPSTAGTPDYIDPMVVTPGNHDGTAKTLLNGFQLPARTPVTAATAALDLKDALDNIFQHQNVGPFISRNLIEHLVTSNPSPSYIARITAVFNDNGSGVRGDLKEVVRAILLDRDARNVTGASVFGHLLEPILFKARLLRAFNTTSSTTDFVLSDSYLPSELIMSQDLFRSGSVFNYYPPMFNIPGVGANGPEFAIQSTSTSLARVNFVAETTYKTMSVSNPNRPKGTWLDLSSVTPFAGSPSQLTGYLNTLMRHGQMSPDLLTTVNNVLAAMPSATSMAKAQEAVYLIGSSPEYFVEK